MKKKKKSGKSTQSRARFYPSLSMLIMSKLTTSNTFMAWSSPTEQKRAPSALTEIHSITPACHKQTLIIYKYYFHIFSDRKSHYHSASLVVGCWEAVGVVLLSSSRRLLTRCKNRTPTQMAAEVLDKLHSFILFLLPEFHMPILTRCYDKISSGMVKKINKITIKSNKCTHLKAVKSINCFQNKSLCIHNLCICTVYLYVYKYTCIHV